MSILKDGKLLYRDIMVRSKKLSTKGEYIHKSYEINVNNQNHSFYGSDYKRRYMYRFFLLFCFISGINSYYNAKGLSHNISQDFVRDTIYTTFEKYDRTVVRYENKIVNHIKRKVVIINSSLKFEYMATQP